MYKRQPLFEATGAVACSVLQDLRLITKRFITSDRQKQVKTRLYRLSPRDCTRHSPGYSSKGNIL